MTEAKHTPNWGAAEHAARVADLAEVKAGRMTLQEAQARARSRQRKAGLTRAQASTAVSDHSRELRRAEARAALNRAEA